jgi:hypothetical protein
MRRIERAVGIASLPGIGEQHFSGLEKVLTDCTNYAGNRIHALQTHKQRTGPSILSFRARVVCRKSMKIHVTWEYMGTKVHTAALAGG